MSATTTIARLREEVRKLRAERPDVAALYDENQLLKEAVAEYARLTQTVGGAIASALENPVTKGGVAWTVSDEGDQPALGGGSADVTDWFFKSLGAEKARKERLAKASDDLLEARKGALEPKLEQARKRREERSR